jgi:O-succinylbenzoate synthase
MSEQQPTPSTEPWPEGVIARYLTVGGATVDLTDDSARDYIVATCTGERCGWQERTGLGGYIYDTPEQTQARVEAWLPESQREAQAHAEKCRALPRPAAVTA